MISVLAKKNKKKYKKSIFFKKLILIVFEIIIQFIYGERILILMTSKNVTNWIIISHLLL